MIQLSEKDLEIYKNLIEKTNEILEDPETYLACKDEAANWADLRALDGDGGLLLGPGYACWVIYVAECAPNAHGLFMYVENKLRDFLSSLGDCRGVTVIGEW